MNIIQQLEQEQIAKLYYLRDRRGKSARIAERVERPSKAPVAAE